MRCPRCSAFLLDDVVFLEDTPDGLYAVVDAPVADHVVACRCGLDLLVSSTRAVTHHPGQLRLAPPVDAELSTDDVPSDPQGSSAIAGSTPKEGAA